MKNKTLQTYHFRHLLHSTNSIRILPLYKRGANLSRYSLYSKATIIKNSEPSLFILLEEDASSRKENNFLSFDVKKKG